jgi:hypothetical protein
MKILITIPMTLLTRRLFLEEEINTTADHALISSTKQFDSPSLSPHIEKKSQKKNSCFKWILSCQSIYTRCFFLLTNTSYKISFIYPYSINKTEDF